MGGGTSKGGVKVVPYDEWGREINIKKYKNGYIEDVLRSDQEPDIRRVTKKDVLDDIDAWRNDDGTYGDNDVKIYLAYKNGDVVDADDLDGKPYKKAGLTGASISTGDYEMVWGGETNKRTGEVNKWQTWSEDGESGKSNSYSGYKTVAVWRERVYTHYEPRENGKGYRAVREVLRRSTKKKVD